MLFLAFIRWWYTDGWLGSVLQIQKYMTSLGRAFSVTTLLKTLFSPWRRIISYPGAGLAAHFAAWRDNMLGRFIGFFVRLTVLIATGIMALMLFVIGTLYILIWPTLPLLVPASLIWGVLQ